MSTINFYQKKQCRFCGKINYHICRFTVNDLIYDLERFTLDKSSPIQDENFPGGKVKVAGNLVNNCEDQVCQELEGKYIKYNNIMGLFENRYFKGLLSPVQLCNF